MDWISEAATSQVQGKFMRSIACKQISDYTWQKRTIISGIDIVTVIMTRVMIRRLRTTHDTRKQQAKDGNTNGSQQ